MPSQARFLGGELLQLVKAAVQAVKQRKLRVWEYTLSSRITKAQKCAKDQAARYQKKKSSKRAKSSGRRRLRRGTQGAWAPRSAVEEVAPRLREQFPNVNISAVHPSAKAVPVERAVGKVLRGEGRVAAVAKRSVTNRRLTGRRFRPPSYK